MSEIYYTPQSNNYQAANADFQTSFNAKQAAFMQNMYNAIISGDVNRIDQQLKNFKNTGDSMGIGLGDWEPALRAIASDYINLGGISPETLGMISGKKGIKGDLGTGTKGYKHNKAERSSGRQAASRAFQQLARSLPQIQPGEAAGTAPVKMLGMPAGMSPAEYMNLFVTNKLSQELDPVSRQETQQWLARANPTLFRAYGMRPMQAAAPVEAAPTAERLNALAGQLDFGKLRAQLPLSVPAAIGENQQGTGGALDWTRRYLQTAAQGMGGTRGQQQLAAGQLRTLGQEAGGNPAMQQYQRLAENLVNPVLKQSSLSNMIGQGRALQQPSGGFRRKGFAGRNPLAL